MSRLGNDIVEILSDSHYVSPEDKKLYLFALERIKTIVIGVILTIFIGFTTNNIKYLIILMISFSITRRYAGGYHMNSPAKCMVFSGISLFSVSVAEKIWIYTQVHIVVFAFAIIWLVYFSPVMPANKNYTYDDIEKYRLKNIVICITAVVLVTIMYVLCWHCEARAVSSGCNLCAFLQAVEIFRRKIIIPRRIEHET